MTEFHLHPADPDSPVPMFTLRAAEDWDDRTVGYVTMQFWRRQGRTNRPYATISRVPHGMEGRAVAVWILAHPWRPCSAARMLYHFAMMRLAQGRHG